MKPLVSDDCVTNSEPEIFRNSDENLDPPCPCCFPGS